MRNLNVSFNIEEMNCVKEEDSGSNDWLENELFRRHFCDPSTRLDGGVYYSGNLNKTQPVQRSQSPYITADEFAALESDEIKESVHNSPRNSMKFVPMDHVTSMVSKSAGKKSLRDDYIEQNDLPAILILPGGKRIKPKDMHIELSEEMLTMLSGEKSSQSFTRLSQFLDGVKDSPLIPNGGPNSNVKTCWAISIQQLLERLIFINERYDELYSCTETLQGQCSKLLTMVTDNASEIGASEDIIQKNKHHNKVPHTRSTHARDHISPVSPPVRMRRRRKAVE